MENRSHSFIFNNSSEDEINDIFDPEIFHLEGHRYEIIIKPKCAFWRIGLRLFIGNLSPGYSTTSRYNNPQVRHIEVCVGTRANDKWENSNQLQLQQYHIPETKPTLTSFDRYIERSKVRLVVAVKSGTKKIQMELSSDDFSDTMEVDLGFYTCFQIWGWADKTTFEIETEIIPKLTPLVVDLESIKALSSLKVRKTITLEKLSIFFGPNNCGKTSLLVATCNSHNNAFYSSVDYLGTNRVFSNSEYDIKIDALDKRDKESRQNENRRRRTKNKVGQNEVFDWMEELVLQEENTRSEILDWIGQHFEAWELQEQKTGKYVTGIQAKVNQGHPLDQGTGARAVLSIIIQLFNSKIDILAIDEPELGLEPRMQKLVFKAIKDATEGVNGFPLKRVLLATHSHLFLDREEIRNNFSVQKFNEEIVIKQLTESTELQEATYNLLGCNPSDLFFPSNIVIVEGKSDEVFLKTIYRVGKEAGYFNSSNLVFHRLDGYEKLSHASEAIVQMLKTQVYSPVYKERICGLFDQPKKKTKLISKIREYFNDIKEERFVLLDEYAIEYYYPISIINRMFGLNYTSKQYSDEIAFF